jgi:hypothetical protein
MRSAVTCMSNRRYPPASALLVLAAAAPVVLAQSANCEAFKERLAASIEGNGVRGYALEIVPSGSPAPLGARSLGTCDGGAYTVLYWRWAQARGEAAPAAPPTSVTDAPAATPRPSPANPSAAPDVADASNPPPAVSPPSMAPTAAPSPAPTSAHDAAPARFAGFARVVAFVVTAAAAIVGGVWAWRWMRRRRYYDEAGLPRGPRITLH